MQDFPIRQFRNLWSLPWPSSVQADVSDTDYPASERSKVHECFSAVQQLFRSRCICYSIWNLKAESSIRELYSQSCQSDLDNYEKLISAGIDHDAAGYATPQGLRNVLIISATPYQWKHMIGQRTCRRNTDETRIVMLNIWKKLYSLSPILFAPGSDRSILSKKCLHGKTDVLPESYFQTLDAVRYFRSRLSIAYQEGGATQ